MSKPGQLTAYRTLGVEGGEWPAWMRELRGVPGCYVIRANGANRPLYVGSSKGNLYNTITRHFQQWKRQKNWWKGYHHGQGHDPGLTYARSGHQVAIEYVPGGKYLEREAALIAKLKPRDNLTQNPAGGELEPAPF